MARRSLIVNADDFGLSEGTNRGIIEAHEHGIVTSTSLMVRQPAVASAVAYAKEHPAFSVGLHLDLGEWEWRDGEWFQTARILTTDDPVAVAAEIEHQVETFLLLMGRKPTHLDSHQHVHRHEPALGIALAVATRLAVPLRGVTGGIPFCGHFYGHGQKASPYPEGISVENLLRLLHELPAGTTELSCHPGLDETLASCYRTERIAEVRTLCDPRVRETVRTGEIRLTGF